MDYLEAFKLSETLFNIVGFNPLVKKYKRLYRFYGIFMHLVFCDLFLLLQTIYLIKVDNILVITEILSIYLTYVGLFMKSFLAYYLFNDVVKLVIDFKDILLICERELP